MSKKKPGGRLLRKCRLRKKQTKYFCDKVKRITWVETDPIIYFPPTLFYYEYLIF